MRLIDVDALSEKFIKECAEECAICPMCDGRQYNNPKLLHCKIIIDAPIIDRPQGEWIPCSERLPSEQGQYLVTFPLCNGEPWVYILSFNKGKFYETDDEWGDVDYDDVIAWMPLPEPWKGADDE